MRGRCVRSARVLVVEDDPQVLGVVRAMLERHGHQVTAAEDGQSGLKLFRQHEGDLHLVVADLILPGMSGADMVRSLLALRPDIGIVFISGYSREFIRKEIEGLNFELVCKPFSPDRLLKAVRSALARRGGGDR